MMKVKKGNVKAAKSAATKEKILKAARELFVENGFAGTSISKIAAIAEVPTSLIFHHFKNKQSLWQDVKVSMVRSVEEGVVVSKFLPKYDQPFEKFLKQMMENGIEFYRGNPDIIRMMNWQRLESGQENSAKASISRESDEWLKVFAHYQNIGEIDKRLNPKFIMTLIVSIISSAALDPNVFIEKQNDFDAYIKFCIEGLLRVVVP